MQRKQDGGLVPVAETLADPVREPKRKERLRLQR